MKRDPDIQKVFEVADDSLQGVLGFHHACMHASPNSALRLSEKVCTIGPEKDHLFGIKRSHRTTFLKLRNY